MNNSKEVKFGTCTAKITDQGHELSFTGSSFRFYPNSKNIWTFSALTGEANPNHQNSLFFKLLDEGDVVEKTYALTKDASNAFASWSKVISGSTAYFSSTHGSMTVTLNRSMQTIEASFNFEGEDGTGKKVTVEQGHLKIEGFG